MRLVGYTERFGKAFDRDPTYVADEVGFVAVLSPN
jgi:hypothetical protein